MSLKLYKYICGHDERVGVAKNDEEAYEKRTEIDPAFSFLAVKIEEFVVPGYVIHATPEKPVKGEEK